MTFYSFVFFSFSKAVVLLLVLLLLLLSMLVIVLEKGAVSVVSASLLSFSFFLVRFCPLSLILLSSSV